MKKKKATKKPAPKPKAKAQSGIMPLADRVLVRPFNEGERETKNNFGIIIPDTVTKERSAEGKVLAVGEGKMVEGKLIPVRVKVGDTVIFSKYGYDEVMQGEEELYLLKEDNILAIIK